MKHIIRFVLLSLFVVLLIATASAQSFENLTNEAIEAGIRKDYRLAIDRFRQALLLDPGNHFIYNQISRGYYLLGSLDSAHLYADSTLRIRPTDSLALFQRGHIYLDQNQFDKALRDFTIAYDATDKRSADLAFNIGKAYFNLGDLQNAIYFYKRTIVLEPNDKYALYELGVSYASFQPPEKDSARKYYSKAIEVDRDYFDAYYNRGLLLATQFRDLAEAQADLAQSIQLRPDAKLSYLYSGILYREAKDYGKAKDMFQKLIDRDPEYAEAYFERAITWYEIGILNMVCRDLEKAESLGHKKAKESRESLCN